MSEEYLGYNDLDEMSRDTPLHYPPEEMSVPYSWSHEPDWWEQVQIWVSAAGSRALDELIIVLGLGTIGFIYGRYNSTGQWVIDDIGRGVVGWIIGGELSRVFWAYFLGLGMPGSSLTVIGAAILAMLISKRKGGSRRRVP